MPTLKLPGIVNKYVAVMRFITFTCSKLKGVCHNMSGLLMTPLSVID